MINPKTNNNNEKWKKKLKEIDHDLVVDEPECAFDIGYDVMTRLLGEPLCEAEIRDLRTITKVNKT